MSQTNYSFIRIALIVFLSIWVYNTSWATNGVPRLSISYVKGNEINDDLSLYTRLRGVKEVQLLVPKLMKDNDAFIFSTFESYLEDLGLVVIKSPIDLVHKPLVLPYGDFAETIEMKDGADAAKIITNGMTNPFVIIFTYIVYEKIHVFNLIFYDAYLKKEYPCQFTVKSLNRQNFLRECYNYIGSYRSYNPDFEYRPSYYKANCNEKIESYVQKYFSSNLSKYNIEGIYENDDETKVAIISNESGNLYALYIDNDQASTHWKDGDVLGILKSTSQPNLFLADWYNPIKLKSKVKLIFNEMGFSCIPNDKNEETVDFIKIYPTNNTFTEDAAKWSGTGFAIGEEYLITNHHVVEGATNITGTGINGNFDYDYEADVIAVDPNNDLALIQVSDYSFNGFGNIPYRIKNGLSNVGEDVFVLGYPLTSTMGDEIKLTTGVISSKSGFQGDISLYQISAPIQPGNSGGPLFDARGNVIGVICAKHGNAENVSYAIKSSYLLNLVESAIDHFRFPATNQISALSRPQKIQKVKNFVVMIKCSK